MRSSKLNFFIRFLPFFSLVLFVFLSVLAIKLVSPPKPKGLDVPVDQFSAERAFKHIGYIAQWPNMSGSPENDLVCNYIVNELEMLGIEVDIQSTTVLSYKGMPIFANITNIVGRIRGTDSSKAILVVGHYDTQPHTPGAADDGIAIGSMLEAARVLRYTPKPQNDIILLFTDAEEVGLLGAEAFAQEHPWMDEVGFVLNLEARGNSGAALAFEVSPNNGWIIREFIKGVNRPYAGSMMYEVYKTLPNNTDFTVFRNRGLSGFNVAIVEGFVNYHSATDTPENLDLASLQHMGSYIISIVQHFGDIPLENTKGKDLVYFNYFGHKMLYYPANLSIWIFVVVVILFLTCIFFGYARNYLSLGRMFIGLIYTLFIVAVALGVVWGTNALILSLYPHYGVFYMNNFYNVGLYFMAYTALTITFLFFLFPFLFRFINIYNVIASIFLIFILISAYLLWKLPTASYLTLVPLVFGLLAVNVLLFFDIEKSKKPWTYHLILLIGIVPFIFLVSPYIYMIFLIFGLQMPYAGAGMLTMLVLLGLPFMEDAIQRYRRVLPSLTFLSVIVFLVIAHVFSEPTKERPLQSNLMYAALSDSDIAYWFSKNLNTDEWNKQFFTNPEIDNASEFYPWRQRQMLKAKAEPITFEKPSIDIIHSSIDDEITTLEFLLKSKLDPVIMELIFPLESRVKTFSVNGKIASNTDTQISKRIGHHLIRIMNPNYRGDIIRIEYQNTDSLSFSLIEVMLGIPQFDYVKPMPEHIIPDTDFESLVTVVASKQVLY